EGLRLLRQQRIGTGVDGETIDLLAEDHTPGARCALEDCEPDTTPMQLVADRKAGDAATDDDDVNSTHGTTKTGTTKITKKQPQTPQRLRRSNEVFEYRDKRRRWVERL